MRPALTERQTLIETAARRLLHDAQEARAAWVARLGQPSPRPEARERWEAHAATVALYRYRYDIIGTSPLGDKKTSVTAEQGAEHRAATAALRRAQAIGQRIDAGPYRRAPRIDHGHRL
ncbi:hypothetical protein [Brachybacterium saurashtrense]|uniref:hypothetical protein n=1 Tax=Brachybacterium saurashtrense TaxID=556288 RepID=UPI0019CF8482|nr:hypothetical protein [Brachybacterium saurashtrense]